MIKQQWEKVGTKIDGMSKRERVLIFVTVIGLAISLINLLLLEPLLVRQKALRGQISQQQQQMSALQTQIAAVLQENSPNSNAPQRNQIKKIQLEIDEGKVYLNSNREKLVQPGKMADHLRQLLSKNNRLQLVALQTLPVTQLIEQPKDAQTAVAASEIDKQVFKHGVQLTLRGNYMDLLQYLSALENLPQQMFWAKAQMTVGKYPLSELTLILYTLSLDKTWLQI